MAKLPGTPPEPIRGVNLKEVNRGTQNEFEILALIVNEIPAIKVLVTERLRAARNRLKAGGAANAKDIKPAG